MFDTFFHKWLRVPYTLHVRHHHTPKRSVATLVFIHGIGNSGAAWDEVIEKLPNDIRIITVDLLGFGNSPRPSWAKYDAKLQAVSVAATLLKLGIVGKVTIVGHSLGALVAIELAKSYSFFVGSLILCSPPLYRSDEHLLTSRLPSSDRVLKALFTSVKGRPDQFVKLSAFAMKYELVNKSFTVNSDNIHSYMTALEAMIINQTSYEDALRLSVPTHIIRGSLDPFVVAKNLRTLKKSNPNITIQQIIAGHEVKGVFIPPVVRAIRATIGQTVVK